jgi:adenine phosphoribosyltransferase
MRDALDQAITFIEGHADVWGIFRDGRLFSEVVAALAEPLRPISITKVAGVEARGFILGGAVAARLGVGLAAIRKADGLYPGPKVVERTATPDYRGRTHELRLQTAAVIPGDRVVLVDDWIETGNQAVAARSMIERCGAEWVGVSVVVDQLAADRRHLVGQLRALIDATRLSGA